MNTQLSPAEVNFLQNIVTPCFMGSIKKDIFLLIMDRTGTIITASKQYLAHLNYSESQEFAGQNLNYLDSYHNPQLLQQIKIILEKVIVQQKIVNFIKFFCIENKLKAHSMSFIPLFNPDGSTVGVLLTAKPYYYLTPKEYFDHICSTKLKRYTVKQKQALAIKLTSRQNEALYLLIYGFTQLEIAQALNITRGSIARTLGQVSKKLGIEGGSTKLLIQKSIEFDLHKLIPTSLLTPKIIVTDEN